MKGYHLSLEGIQKGYLFCPKWYIKEAFQGGRVGYAVTVSVISETACYLVGWMTIFIVIFYLEENLAVGSQ